MHVDQLFTHVKKLVEALSLKQLVGLGLAFVAVVAVVIGSAYWLARPDYALLMGDMDPETASAVVSRLTSAKTPYRLGDGGRSVSVPVERLDELRLQFAADGVPAGGRLGFELFDRPAFGTTEFLEHVNYRRALEGELARTIATLSEVSSARVHIAMAKDSVFVGQAQPAKASVVLRLKANRPLAPATVRGIAGLVSASVESLRAESVTILDTYGRFLSRPADDGGESASGAAQIERQQQLERELANRVTALLEPAVGEGRVRVNVAATLTANVTEETEERFDPEAVVRSRQTTTETAAAALPPGGVAGARANQPPGLSTSPSTTAEAAPSSVVAAARSAQPGRSSEITNYEVSRVTRHTVSGVGQLARLSVAVIIDDQRIVAAREDGTTSVTTRPWEPAELQRLHGLVATAVGYNADRGDQITLENMSFEAPPAETDTPSPSFGSQIVEHTRQHWMSLLKVVAIVVIAVFALFGVIRPLLRQAAVLAQTPALPAASPLKARLPTISDMEGRLNPGEGNDDASGRPLPAVSKRVAKLAAEEPEQLARIVRGWMVEDPR